MTFSIEPLLWALAFAYALLNFSGHHAAAKWAALVAFALAAFWFLLSVRRG